MDTILKNLTKDEHAQYAEEVTDVTDKIKLLCSSRQIAIISSGGTKVKLDAKGEYMIDNFASGWRGVYLTENLIDQGFFVIFLYRKTSHVPYERSYSHVNEETVNMYNERLQKIKNNRENLVCLSFDFIFEYLYKLWQLSENIQKLNCSQKVMYIMAAAVSDFYVPLEDLPDDLEDRVESITMKLKTTPKILGLIKKLFPKPNFIMVSFKLETDETILEDKVIKSFNSNFSDYIVGNVLSTRNKRLYLYHMVEGKHEVIVIEKEVEGQGILEAKLVKLLVDLIK